MNLTCPEYIQFFKFIIQFRENSESYPMPLSSRCKFSHKQAPRRILICPTSRTPLHSTKKILNGSTTVPLRKTDHTTSYIPNFVPQVSHTNLTSNISEYLRPELLPCLLQLYIHNHPVEKKKKKGGEYHLQPSFFPPWYRWSKVQGVPSSTYTVNVLYSRIQDRRY